MEMKLSDQSEETLRIAEEALKEFNANPTGLEAVGAIAEAHAAAWAVHEKWMLAEEARLIEELRHTVLGLSAKIRTIRMLQKQVFYQVGMQDGIRDSISEKRGENDDKGKSVDSA